MLLAGFVAFSLASRTAAASDAGKRMTPNAAELKKMNVFLSNFTEQGFTNFDVKAGGDDELLHMGGKGAAPDLIRFGIRHNYLNNYKIRIAPCPTKGCEHGSLTIDGRYVAESVKKYFDLDLKNQSVLGSAPLFFDGKRYHFEGADGEATCCADIRNVFANSDGTLRMTGELYNADDRKDRPATFEATARRHGRSSPCGRTTGTSGRSSAFPRERPGESGRTGGLTVGVILPRPEGATVP